MLAFFRRALAWALACLLSGGVVCAEAPAPVFPAADGAGAASLMIYRGDLSVSGAVQLGLFHSPELEMVRWETRAREAERLSAEAASRPKLGLGTFLNAQNTPMMYSTNAEPRYMAQQRAPGAVDLNVMLMYPLFSGGGFEHRLEAAALGERAALAREALSVRRVVREIRDAFYRWEAEQALLQVTRAEQQARQEMVRLVETRLQAGRVARFVLLRARSELADVLQRQAERESGLTEADARLKSRMGVAPESRFEYQRSDELPPAPGTLDEEIHTALEQRPDVVAARFGVEQADQSVLAAVAEYEPKLSAVAMGEALRNDPFRSGPTNLGYSVGLVFSFPLYDGGEREASEQAARAIRGERRAELRALQLRVIEEVTAAHSRLEAALRRVELARTEVASADEELRLARLRFEVGRGLYLEVLDGLAAQVRARTNRVRALYEAQIAYSDLLFALGRLQ